MIEDDKLRKKIYKRYLNEKSENSLKTTLHLKYRIQFL